LNLRIVVEDVIVLAESIGWKLEERHEASTFTTYLDFSREKDG